MISIITSLYRTDTHIKKYQKRVRHCVQKLLDRQIPFEVIAIANDPTPQEKEILIDLAKESWFRFYAVPRESLYASWNRGVHFARGIACTPWNVDDIRFPEALEEALNKIKSGAALVYFPFIYKRYIRIGGIPLLAKRKLFVPPLFERTVFLKGMHCGPFFVFSKKLYQQIGPFDETFKIAGDYEWCVRAAGTTNLVRGECCGGIFTNDGQTLSGSRNNRLNEENRRVEIVAAQYLNKTTSS